MSSEWVELSLGECLLKVVDNRGKTPPLADDETPYGLIEINAIVGQDKSPNYAAVRKYVSAETYDSWFRAGHPIPGDLLFSTVGSIAEVAMFNGGGRVHSAKPSRPSSEQKNSFPKLSLLHAG